MTTRRVIAFLAIAAVAVAAGCGGSESSEPVATTQVTMAKSYRFDPKVIEVKAGDTVTWTNEDSVQHDVMVTAGPATFHSPMLSKGQSWSETSCQFDLVLTDFGRCSYSL